MGNVNKVFLMGNLTRDPELRYTPGGTAVCELGIATNRRYKTQDGEQKEEVCFVSITFWSRRGEVISEYFKKGDPIFIEGRLKFDQWETPDGRQSRLTVVGEDFQFLGSGGSGSGSGADGDGRRTDTRRSSNRPARRAAPPEPEEAGEDVSDDEIPF